MPQPLPPAPGAGNPDLELHCAALLTQGRWSDSCLLQRSRTPSHALLLRSKGDLVIRNTWAPRSLFMWSRQERSVRELFPFFSSRLLKCNGGHAESFNIIHILFISTSGSISLGPVLLDELTFIIEDSSFSRWYVNVCKSLQLYIRTI